MSSIKAQGFSKSKKRASKTNLRSKNYVICAKLASSFFTNEKQVAKFRLLMHEKWIRSLTKAF
jgi:hypothetical protein